MDTQLLNRWVRLNSDICEDCNQPKFIKLHLDFTLQDFYPLQTTITCSCPNCIFEPYKTNWAQVDNITVDYFISAIDKMITNSRYPGRKQK